MEDFCQLILQLIEKAKRQHLLKFPHWDKDLYGYCDAGWLRILDASDPNEAKPVLLKFLGDHHAHSEECERLATEKADRLFAHPEHKTSRESRDESKEQYGGAIRAGKYILSFSGLPERWDEALMLAAAYRIRLLTLEDVRTIANEETFPCFEGFVCAGLLAALLKTAPAERGAVFK